MLESFLRGGRQEPGDLGTLTYGQSVTDACMDFGTTASVFEGIAAAVRERRWTAPNAVVGDVRPVLAPRTRAAAAMGRCPAVP